MFIGELFVFTFLAIKLHMDKKKVEQDMLLSPGAVQAT